MSDPGDKVPLYSSLQVYGVIFYLFIFLNFSLPRPIEDPRRRTAMERAIQFLEKGGLGL